MPERLQTNEHKNGLLPHEREFVTRCLAAAAISKTAADATFSESVADSGGDWAFDDAATQAAVQEARVADVRVGRQQALLHLPTVEYPNPDELRAQVGSRITLETPQWKDIYDMTSSAITDMPAEDGVELLSAESPMGQAILGKVVGDTIEWMTPNGRLTGIITHVDQIAQRRFYEGDEQD